jgi:hypothetical protein
MGKDARGGQRTERLWLRREAERRARKAKLAADRQRRDDAAELEEGQAPANR